MEENVPRFFSTIYSWFLLSATSIYRAKELSFLPASTKVTIGPNGDSVAEEVAKSQSSQGSETVRARQAHFVNSGILNPFEDPAGQEIDLQIFLASYANYVMAGINYLNKSSVRSATCKGYTLDAARFLTLRG